MLINKNAIYLFLISIVTLLLTAFIFNRFLAWHELRPGIYFDDPVFRLYKGIDLSLPTFLALYASILFFIFYHRKNLILLSKLALSYVVVLWLRLICLYFIPLYADADIVKLVDPFLYTFIYPGDYVERDLFFSGHVAILVLLVIWAESQKLKWIFLVSTIFIGVALVLQKVHFSIDVVAAPFFSLLAAWIIQKLFERFNLVENKNS